MADDVGSSRAFGALPATVRGALWMVTGGIMLLLLAIVIRHLQSRYHILEMILLRSVVSFFLILPWAVRQGAFRLKTQRFGLHFFRNGIHYLGNVGWFLGVTLIPLADVSALQFTVPLFTIVMAALFLREAVGAHRWVATVVGFVGALLIIRPGFIEIGLGTAAVVGSAVFYAASTVSTRALAKTDSPNAILFYMAVIFIPISAVPAAMVWTMPTLDDAIPIVLLGVSGTLAHACIIRAFAAAEASFIIPFDFLRLPFSALFGFILYREQPDLWVWIGAVIIFGATYYITRRENQIRKQVAAQ